MNPVRFRNTSFRYAKRLHETKEALLHREGRSDHTPLQISHEGLGVFNKDKKEILVNNLFTQYSNLISDSNLETAEEVFNISELKEDNGLHQQSSQTSRRQGGETNVHHYQ